MVEKLVERLIAVIHTDVLSKFGVINIILNDKKFKTDNKITLIIVAS